MSKLVFIRHAQASYMSDNYDNLSDLGIAQSRALGKYLLEKDIHFDRIFTGPLKRHHQTFEYCISVMDVKHSSTPVELDGLKEHNGPEALRLEYDNLHTRYEQIALWKEEIAQNPDKSRRNSLRIFRLFMQEWMAGIIEVDHPSVLPFDVWRNEIREALDAIKSSVNSSETVGIFTSGGTIGAIIAETLEIMDGRKIANLNDSIRNTSMSHFHYSGLGFNILSFNEIPHLDPDQITFV